MERRRQDARKHERTEVPVGDDHWRIVTQDLCPFAVPLGRVDHVLPRDGQQDHLLIHAHPDQLMSMSWREAENTNPKEVVADERDREDKRGASQRDVGRPAALGPRVAFSLERAPSKDDGPLNKRKGASEQRENSGDGSEVGGVDQVSGLVQGHDHEPERESDRD